MITIYHNPRCSKSREALQILEDKNLDFEVIKYLDEPLTLAEMQELLTKLGMEPAQLLRKNEAIWKEQFADKEMEDEELMLVMIEHPKLMERPIIVNGNSARIGRPPESILEIL